MKEPGEAVVVAEIDRESLRQRLGDRVRFDEPLSRHTSFRIGGPADVWVDAESLAEIKVAKLWAAAAGLPILVLGGGTNVLVSDRGVRGLVLHLGNSFRGIDWRQNGAGEYVRAGAATPLKRLVTEAIHRDLCGLEFAEGIPGTLGGGLLMNAGAFGGEISDVLTEIEGVDEHGVERCMPRSELKFGYRRFDLEPGFVVTAVQFHLLQGDRAQIRTVRDDAKRRRARNQPVGYPNAGSVFKNPTGSFAGRLIESVGLRGHRIGNAMFSERHANFIVNLGEASASDVRDLMQLAVARVRQEHQVTLEPEVRLVGEWET